MPIIGSQGAWQGQDRLDEAARRAVQVAEALGAAYGQRQSAPDMLLLALLDDRDAVPARALTALDVDLDAVGGELDRVVKRRGSPLDGRSALDADAREAVILGVNEARRAGFNQAGAGHVLLGVLEARTPGARVLARQGVAVGPLRDIVNGLEQAGALPDAHLFAAGFARLLARIGGGAACPTCQAVLHHSFHYCYNCGRAVDE